MVKKQRKIAVMGFRAVGTRVFRYVNPFLDPCAVFIEFTVIAGKSSISLQFCENHFVESYNPTIENTFQKTIRINADEFVTEIVDTAGQVRRFSDYSYFFFLPKDEHSNFQPQYAIGIHGYILVYAVTNRFSFNLIKTLNDKILNAVGVDKVPRVLGTQRLFREPSLYSLAVGNKIDLDRERQVPTSEGQALANEWRCAFVECSAKQNSNVGQIFTACLTEVEKAQGPPQAPQSDCVLL